MILQRSRLKLSLHSFTVWPIPMWLSCGKKKQNFIERLPCFTTIITVIRRTMLQSAWEERTVEVKEEICDSHVWVQEHRESSEIDTSCLLSPREYRQRDQGELLIKTYQPRSLRLPTLERKWQTWWPFIFISIYQNNLLSWCSRRPEMSFIDDIMKIDRHSLEDIGDIWRPDHYKLRN